MTTSPAPHLRAAVASVAVAPAVLARNVLARVALAPVAPASAALAPVALALGLALALATGAPAPARAVVLLPAGFADDTLVTGLDEPNSMAFLPDGRVLFTEVRNGRVRMIVGDHVAASDPLVTVAGLVTLGTERGLQGIAVDPRWPDAPYVYVAYTHTGSRIWLERYTATGDLDDPAGEAMTLGSPYVVMNDLRDLFANHNGLGLRFDTTGHLLFSLGEDSDPCAAQQVDSLRGALLRLDVTRLPAGPGGPPPRALLIPPGNPFAGPDSAAMLVYAYGMRNPWRFHVDPESGDVMLADVGEDKIEEIDAIVAGGNYGWPVREGTLPGRGIPCEPAADTMYIEPVATWLNGVSSIAIHTAGFYRPAPGGTANWPVEYHGDFFYGDYYHSRLRRLRKTAGTWAPAPPAPGQPDADNFALGIYWSADFAVGPDGSLYWLKAWDDSFNPSSGMLRRIRWTGVPAGVGAPGSAAALFATPNPFRDAVTIALRRSSAGAFSVGVFDLAGRRVRTLEAGAAAAHVVWDGRDELGRDVPAGLYLVRTAGVDAPAARVLRIR